MLKNIIRGREIGLPSFTSDPNIIIKYDPGFNVYLTRSVDSYNHDSRNFSEMELGIIINFVFFISFFFNNHFSIKSELEPKSLALARNYSRSVNLKSFKPSIITITG